MAGELTTGALARGIGLVTGAGVLPYLGFVATNGKVPTIISVNANKQYNARSFHRAIDIKGPVRVRFGNWAALQSTKVETNPGGIATIKASIEYPAGTYTQLLTLGGSATLVLADGGEDDMYASVVIPDGASFWVREFRIAANGVPYLANSGTLINECDTGNGEGWEYGASLTDKTMGGTISNTATGSYLPMAKPLAILGMTMKPSALLVGDSGEQGAGDTFDATGDIGEGARAIGSRFGYCNAGLFGDRVGTFLTNGTKRAALQQFASHVHSNYGSNDITGGASLAVVQSALQSFWLLFSPKKIIHNTITPVTTSNNNWRDAVGQTVNANSSNITALNSWLKSYPSPLLVDIPDVASVVCDPSDSQKWKTDGATDFLYTVDGSHDTRLAFLAEAQQFNLNAIVT